MRVAAVADIHGNLPALDAVLADVQEEGADLIVLNGDLADGPMPAPTLDRLAELGDRAVWVRGHSDRRLVDAFDGNFMIPGLDTDPSADWFEWCAARLNQGYRDQLADLPPLVTLDVDGLGPVAFCHATARDDGEYILVDSPIAHYKGAFAGVAEPTVVVAHTHMPFDRLAAGRRVINVGSVGLQYGHQGASWAMLGPDVALRRTRYDARAAAAVLRSAARDLPGVESFTANVRAPASDEQALNAFTMSVRLQARER
jgi:predicted phosphodiesterase